MSGKQALGVHPKGSGPIRITLSASVANDLEALKEGIASLAQRTGHPTCFSGVDCHFINEREFVIDAERKAQSWAIPQGPPLAASPTVTVRLSADAGNDITKLKNTVAQVAGRLGCPGCHSGFDIFFAQEVEFMAVGRDGNVQSL
ncbi:MAG TPA: hypothetical protein VEZ90_09370 [Blastocatellia bacterium]|nr:hypothetical protein [Blastocatellia bacterium]